VQLFIVVVVVVFSLLHVNLWTFLFLCFSRSIIRSESLLLIDDFKLELSVGILEPLYFTFALHNRKTCQKISEDFNVVPDSTQELLHVQTNNLMNSQL
jgi:hypothetical protein